MKFLFWFFLSFLSSGVLLAQKASLSPNEFELRIKGGNVQLVDVRTPQEFQKGFIEGARNFDINSADYTSNIKTLKQDQPILIYCLSGARSAQAAKALRKQGYTVFELKGGLLEWKAKAKPLVKSGSAGVGMSSSTFNQHLETSKLVLVDFYAKWCAPCKVMAPDLELLKNQYADDLALLKIDADANALLLDSLQVSALPTLKIFKNGKEVWSKTGLTKKNAIEKQILAHR